MKVQHDKGDPLNRVVEIARSADGFVTTAAATQASIPRRCLTDAVKLGLLKKIDRGLYALPEVWEDEYVVAQHRFARGVFSHGTALFLNGMSDRTPESLTMTFPHGYNTTVARRYGLMTKTVATEFLDLGLVTRTTPYGNKVSTYDAERTLCDMVRGQAVPDVQVLNPAMKAYATSRGKDVNKLLGYAAKLGVESKVRAYLEVLL